MTDVIFDEDYYKKIIKGFGYDPLRFGKIDFNLGAITDRELRARWICHSGADRFAESLKNNKKAIVTTGIGMSGSPHVGTLIQILNAIFLQKNGIPVQMVLGDLDAYNGKNLSLQTVRNLAEKYREFILSLGFKTTEGSILRDQWNDLKILRTMYLCGKYIDDSDFNWVEEDLHEFYVRSGKVDKKMTFRRKLSLSLMTADFIDLYLSDEYEDVLVVLGIDEHKYVLFSQEIFGKMGKDDIVRGRVMAAMYTPMNKGFNNYPKMSKSFPDSSINAEMDFSQIIHRIIYEEGEYETPLESPVYQMMASIGNFGIPDLNVRYKACESKNRQWLTYKKEFAEIIISIFKKWPKG
jgi:tryptophanyl-tRNA synthetase